MHSIDRPLFLFDGDCGLCQNGTDAMQARLHPSVDFASYQGVDYAALGVGGDEVLVGPVLVLPDGSHRVGAAAMAGVLATAGVPYRQAATLMGLPVIRTGLQALGHVLYRNRHRAPGAAGSCELQPPASPR